MKQIIDMFRPYPIRTAFTLSCLGMMLMLAASGCGDGDEGNGVSGTVKLDGKPLTGGNVTFVGQEGDKTPTSSIIQENGSYLLPRAPLGQVKIGVVGPGTPSVGKPTTPPLVVPANYANPDKSGLTYKVTKGTQKHDIELTEH